MAGMYPEDIQEQARRNQFMLMLAQAFGAPQGQFGTGLLQGAYAGNQEYQRTLDAFMAQQQEQQRFDLERRVQEARLAQMTAPQPDPVAERLRMEQGLQEGGYGQYYQPPQPDPVQQRVQMESALKEQGLGSYYQEPQPDPVQQRLRMESALKAQGLGQYYQGGGQQRDPLWEKAQTEAALFVRANKMDPSVLETLIPEYYLSLKEAESVRDQPPPIEWAPRSVVSEDAARRMMAKGEEIPPGTPPRVFPTSLSTLSGMAAKKPPPLPSIEGKGSGGDGSIRLQQLLAEHPEVDRAEVEKARRDGMSDEAISDLIEAQISQQGALPPGLGMMPSH